MGVRISGKNVDIGEALRSRVDSRVAEVLDKYFDGTRTGHVTIAREGSGFRAEAAIHLATGVTLQAAGEANDAYMAADQLMERIEKRLRRYKRKLRSHHAAADRGDNGAEAPIYVLAAASDAAEDTTETDDHAAPPVIAETRTRIRTLTVGMAVMELDLTEAPVIVFKNAAHGRLNVVYRRPDGNVGWIDPTLDTRQDA